MHDLWEFVFIDLCDVSFLFFLVQPLPGWTPIIGPRIHQNRLFWLSMIDMILTRHRGIIDLFARLATTFTLFGWLFSHAGMGCATTDTVSDFEEIDRWWKVLLGVYIRWHLMLSHKAHQTLVFHVKNFGNSNNIILSSCSSYIKIRVQRTCCAFLKTTFWNCFWISKWHGIPIIFWDLFPTSHMLRPYFNSVTGIPSFSGRSRF